jgi:hypothetical protein
MEDEEKKLFSGLDDKKIKKIGVYAMVIGGLMVAYYISNTYLNVLQIKQIKKIK